MDHPPISPSLMTTYYVVPLKPAPGDAFEHCAYFTEDWMGVVDNILQSNSPDFDTDFVRLVQPTFQQLQDHGVDTSRVDADATLFAAVAKTLDVDLGLPSLFPVSNRSLVVPVADSTRRGLILVFSRATGGRITQLIASADPEIQNGTIGT